MGKITKMLKEVREMDNEKLFSRFKHIVRAQAVRDYLGTKEDINLTLEVKYAGEEILQRMSIKIFCPEPPK